MDNEDVDDRTAVHRYFVKRRKLDERMGVKGGQGRSGEDLVRDGIAWWKIMIVVSVAAGVFILFMEVL